MQERIKRLTDVEVLRRECQDWGVGRKWRRKGGIGDLGNIIFIYH